MLRKKIKEHPAICGLIVAGVVLVLNSVCLFVGPFIFPGEAGMVILIPITILNFPLLGYWHYAGISLPFLCLFLSTGYYFFLVYTVIQLFNKFWRTRKGFWSVLVTGILVLTIPFGGICAKPLMLRSAIKALAQEDINPRSMHRHVSTIHRFSSRRDIPAIIRLVKTMSDKNRAYDGLQDPKWHLIFTLQNLRAKEAIPLLLELIKTSDNQIAEKAIEAVGYIKAPDEAVPIIIEYIKKNNYRLDYFLQSQSFEEYGTNTELAQALLQVCTNYNKDKWKQVRILEACVYVADDEMLLKIQEQYKKELSQREYYSVRHAIEKKLMGKMADINGQVK